MQTRSDFSNLASGLSFNFLQPGHERSDDRRFRLRRSHGDAKLLELAYAPVDFANTSLPADLQGLEQTLLPLADVPRMSTLALGALLNRAVAAMPDDHAFLNVGTWMGFSFFTGLLGNPHKRCIGVDNFSEFAGPREAFREGFERYKGPGHRFFDLDYREYFEREHRDPIAVYFYDGEHSYENQRLGLEIAEPYFTDDSIIFVDDTNWPAPFKATYDFIAESERDYTVLLEELTSSNSHPTFWNGLIVVRAGGNGASPDPSPIPDPLQKLPPYAPVTVEPDPPYVSVVVHNEASDGNALGTTIDAALTQSWEPLEVLVANEDSGEATADVVRSYGDRVVAFSREAASASKTGESALAAAIDRSKGDFVGFTSSGTQIRPTGVHVGLAYPGFSQFNFGRAERQYLARERMLRLVEQIDDIVPPGQSYALAHERIELPGLVTSRRQIVFAAGEDGPSDPPASDDEAIAELEHVRERGASFLIFSWTASSWRQRYPRFADRLRATGRQVAASEELVAFDLRH